MRCAVSICFFALWVPLRLFCVSVDVYAGQISQNEAVVGEVVETGGFGIEISGDNYIGRQWDSPRDIYEVRISGIERRDAESLRLEWWGSVWPNNGSGGWMRLDDPWNGKWVRTVAEPKLNKSGEFVFRIPPLNKEEWPRALKPEQYPDKKQPVFRRTLKVRLISEDNNIPDQGRLWIYGNSRWRQATFDIETQSSQNGKISGRVELINGELVSLQSLPRPQSVQVEGISWRRQGAVGSYLVCSVCVTFRAKCMTCWTQGNMIISR